LASAQTAPRGFLALALIACLFHSTPGMAQPARPPLEEPKPALANDRAAGIAANGTPLSLEGIFPEKILVPFEAPALTGADRATPANDACASPTFLTGTGSFPFDSTAATTDGLPHFLCNFFGQSQIASDVWFLWTAPQTANFVADTCANTTFDTKIAVYQGSGPCPPTDSNLLQCNDDACSSQSRVTFSAIAGQPYRIRVGSFPSQPGGVGTLRIGFQGGQDVCNQPPGNCQPRDNTNAFEASGNSVFDDFRTTATGGSVTTVCFSGTYFGAFSPCPDPGPDRFFISYHDDIAGKPSDFPFAEFNFTQFTVVGPVLTGEFINGTIPVYAYKIVHDPVLLQPNKCYWIRIRNILTIEGCSWFWQKGQPGNTIAFQTTEFVSSADLIAADMAFCFNIPINSSTLCQSASAPTNDECANATILNCQGGAIVQNLFASDNPSDPLFSCRLEGPAHGSGSLWFKFQASETSASVDTCATTTGDTLLAVYSGTCGNLTEIACNDDFCGRRSLVKVTGLTVGQTYFIQFATFDSGSRGEYILSLRCPAPAPPTNDTCAGAQLVTLNSFGIGFAIGNTLFATTDTNVPACSFSPLVGPSVWYKVVGIGGLMSASLCQTGFDTKLNVYCGDSCSTLICVAQNDDTCGLQSVVSWCSEPGRTYYILAHGFNGQVGPVSIEVDAFGEPCNPPAPCASCQITCPPGAIQEVEPCGQSLNDGCNSIPAAVQQIACGNTVCGTASAVSTVRDTDWYQFTVTLESFISWTVTANLPVEFSILDSMCPPTILATATIDRCGSGTAAARLQPGTYRVFVANVKDAYPCGSFNSYKGTLTCQPIGACCVGADCLQTTQADCAARAGQFGGPGSVCDITYSAAPCSSPFEDIFPSGAPLSIPNNGGAVVDIGFPFRFYASEFTRVGISSNGYLAFESRLDEPINTPIPSSSTPSNIIAPLWDDLAPSPSGAVQYEIMGSAPDRRFIAQWTNVPQFFMTDSNTFQVVLFESSNCVEFRYLQITPQATAGDYTIGVEDRPGTRGTSVNPATVSSGSCLRLCPVATPAGCQTTGCRGDADHNGSVNFSDITIVLSNWGGAGPVGDANGDLLVNFADITSVLSNWGCAPGACAGDANADRAVNFADITAVLSNWNGPGPAGDANHDGAVNFADITAVLSNWSSPCAP